MKAIVPGHVYLLDSYKADGASQTIAFVQKEQLDRENPELVEVRDGTTTEKVIDVLIHRIEHLDTVLHADENAHALRLLKRAKQQIESRTARRKRRGTEGKMMK